MMHRGSAEEAVVVVKRVANEDMVTYLRIKRTVSAEKKKVGEGEGWNMLTAGWNPEEAIFMRSAKRE
jgi:hypothetical protein